MTAVVDLSSEDESYGHSLPALPAQPVPTFEDAVNDTLHSFSLDSRRVIEQSPVWHEAVGEAQLLHAQISGRARRSAAHASTTNTVGAHRECLRLLRRAAQKVQPPANARRKPARAQDSPDAPRLLPDMSAYEWERQQNIYRNKRMLQSLGLSSKFS